MALSITLDRSERGPLAQQIANRLRSAIATGTLGAGARLPSARGLASELGVARGTVDAAYAMLAGEGAIEPRGPAGTIVARHLAGRMASPEQRPMPFVTPRAAAEAVPPPFRMGLPALDAFPRKLWSRLAVHAARSLGPAELAHPDPAGFRPLREAVAAYLGLSRGITCTAEQVLITGGYQGALGLACSVLLRSGDAVWFEDPGYALARQALELCGAAIVPVPVDRDGMRIATGLRAAPGARLAVVTPTHQSPLGVALSLPRRLALLDWAAEAKSWVLEDDYDSEFRYTGHRLPALKSLDRGERVIYAGTFSKVLFPGLRLGYLVLPDGLAGAFGRAARLLQAGQPLLEQRVAAAFMAEGHFTRHLRRMRLLYAARRQALAAALAGAFGPRMTLELQAGGMHLLARFPGAVDDGELARRAAAAGLAPAALSSLSIAHDCGQGLLLGFTNVPEEDAPELARRLAEVVYPAPIQL